MRLAAKKKLYTSLKHANNSWKHTMELDLKSVSLRGEFDESEGMWNSKCAIDRSMGFVLVSKFTNPVYLNSDRILLSFVNHYNHHNWKCLLKVICTNLIATSGRKIIVYFNYSLKNMFYHVSTWRLTSSHEKYKSEPEVNKVCNTLHSLSLFHCMLQHHYSCYHLHWHHHVCQQF